MKKMAGRRSVDRVLQEVVQGSAAVHKRKGEWKIVDDSKKPRLVEHYPRSSDENLDPCLLSSWVSPDRPERMEQSEKCVQVEEVLPQVLKQMPLKHLKIVRLVSKSWNEQVCSALETRALAVLQENQCKQLMKLQREGEALAMPWPFKCFQVNATTLRDQDLAAILKDKDARLVKLKLTEPGCQRDESPVSFHELLSVKGEDLTHLELDGINFRVREYEVEKAYTGSPGSSRSTTPSGKTYVYYKNEIEYKKERLRSSYFRNCSNKISLPALEHFSFSNFTDETEVEEGSGSEIVAFIVSLINAAPSLKSLHFSRVGVQLLDEILLSCKMPSLIRLNAEGLTECHLDVLASLEWPGLKVLRMQQESQLVVSGGNALNRSTVLDTELLTVVKNFSGSLEELELRWDWSSFDFYSVRCPRLRSLDVKSYHVPLDNLECVTMELFPSLQRLGVHNYYPYRCSEFMEDEPHVGVKSVSIDVSSRGVSHLEPFFASLKLQFPSTSTLRIKLGSDPDCAREVSRCLLCYFPHLMSLGLDGKQSSFEGLRNCFCEDHGTPGRSEKDFGDDEDEAMESYTRCEDQHCLLNLECLKELVLMSNIAVTDDILRLGISKFSSLETLQFFWPQGALSKQVVLKCLKYLKNIVVSDCCKDDTATGLFMEMKSLLCGCKTGSTSFNLQSLTI